MMVKPNYKIASFPVDIKVPVDIGMEFLGGRYLRIENAEQTLPKPVYDWLKSNQSCAGWFDGEGEVIDPEAQNDGEGGQEEKPKGKKKAD